MIYVNFRDTQIVIQKVQYRQMKKTNNLFETKNNHIVIISIRRPNMHVQSD